MFYMKNFLVVLLLLLATPGCITVQMNIGSNVNNVKVNKGQLTEQGSNDMSGSQLEDVVKDAEQSTETDVTGLP